ncbi:MAG: hypothetical protein L0227_13860 [Chloroflexi bacterium]|nr:hypothetical protein [Chloroflexota bacterium]
MTMPDVPPPDDAAVRRYLVARATLVAASAAPAEDMAFRVAVEVGLARRPIRGPGRALRLAAIVALLVALLAGAVYLVGQLRETYAPAQPEMTVELHGSPWGIATLGGSIWTAGYSEPILFEIDPRSGAILAEIPTGKRACGEVDEGFGYVWFTTCPPNAFLGRVDPETHRVDRLNGYGSDRLGFGDGLVWLVHDGSLEGLDPRSLATLVAYPVPRSGPLTFAFDDVWIADADGHVLARVDLVSGQVLAEVVWPAPGDGPNPVHLTEADGALWVVDEAALAVFRVDPATNAATRVDIDLEVIDGTGFGDHPIGFGGGGLWVRESESSIARIHTATLSVAERVTTEALGGGSFVVTDDAVWFANLKGESIVGLQRP